MPPEVSFCGFYLELYARSLGCLYNLEMLVKWDMFVIWS